MSLIAILTITQTISFWLNILIIIAIVFAGIKLLDNSTRVLYRISLDCIQIYTALTNARLDAQERRQLLTIASDEARLKLREQRLLLLGDIDK